MKNLRIVGLKLPSKVVFADTMDIMSKVKEKSRGRLQKLTLDASMMFFFNNEVRKIDLLTDYGHMMIRSQILFSPKPYRKSFDMYENLSFLQKKIAY